MRYAFIAICLLITSCIYQPEAKRITSPREEAMAELVDYAQRTAGMPQSEVYNLVASIRVGLDQEHPPYCPHAGSHAHNGGRDSYQDRYSYHYQNRNRNPEPFEEEGYHLEDAIRDAQDDKDRKKAIVAYESHLDNRSDDYARMEELDFKNREKNYRESIEQARELMEMRHEILDIQSIREARSKIDGISGENRHSSASGR